MIWRRWSGIITSASFFFLIGFVYSYHWPKIKTWALVELENITTKHSSVRVLALDAELSVFPPKFSLKDIKILPMGDLAKKLAPIRISTLSIEPNFGAIFAGHLGVLNILLDSPEITAIIRRQKAKKKAVPSEPFDPNKIFKELPSIPIGKISIENGIIQVRIDEQELLLRANHFYSSVTTDSFGLDFSLKTPKIQFKKRDKNTRFHLATDNRVFLTKDSLKVARVSISKGKSKLSAKGTLSGSVKAKRFDKSDLNLSGSLALQEIRQWALEILPTLELPITKGTLSFDTQFSKLGLATPKLEIKAEGSKLQVDEFQIGDIELAGNSDLSFFRMSRILIKNTAGKILLTNTSYQPSGEFRTQVSSSSLRLNPLLDAIDVKGVPVFLNMALDLPCRGKVTPNFSASCEGVFTGTDLHVTNGEPKNKTIVAMDRFVAKGSLLITDEFVSYKAGLEVRSHKRTGPALSTGRSRGKIIYDKGFNIDFTANQLLFSDLKNLSDLKLEGVSTLKGKTVGDSTWGRVDMDMSIKRGWLEDFGLGQANAKVSYAEGFLNFRQLNGQLGNTRYNGDVVLNLNKNTLESDLKFPFLNATNMQESLGRWFPLPFQISGTGQAAAKVWGPLQPNLLSYDGELRLFRGAFGIESYDDINLSVRSRGGNAAIQEGLLKKGQSFVSIKGQSWPTGKVSSLIQGRDLLLEDSELMRLIGLRAKGKVDFDTKILGSVRTPTISINALLDQLKIGNNPLPPSSLQTTINEEKIFGDVSFFGGNVLGKFSFPLGKGSGYQLKMSSQGWDFTPLLGLMHPEADRLNYSGYFAGELDISSTTPGIWPESGGVKLDRLEFRRGTTGFSNKGPLSIFVRNGVANGKNLELTGEKTFLKAEVINSSARQLNAQINGQLDLSLAGFLLPFIEDLRGPLSFSLKLGGNQSKPEVLGSAYLEGAFVKTTQFPHPMEEIQADILFSHSKLLINSLRSQFASGTAEASGTISIIDISNIPTNIDLTLKGVNIKYPENVETSGNAKLKISSNWFPFKVTGQAEVLGGFSKKELTEFAGESKTVRESRFLPDLFLKTESKLFDLDVDVNILPWYKVENSLANLEFNGNLNVKGSPFKPIVKGSLIGRKGGTLFFRETPFEVEEATLEFAGTPEINPTLFFNAESRVKEFDIEFLLQGTASKPDIQLSSQPSLPNQEIISLLALGLTSSDFEESSSEDQAASTAVIGSNYISKSLIGREIKDKFGVNLQISQDFEDDGGTTQKITIGKKLGSNFEAKASRSSGEQESVDVKLEYQVNKNLSVVGSWEDQNATSSTDVTEQDIGTGNKVGLDLELKFEFK